MWTIKNLTVVDDKGNTISFADKKITIAVKLDNGFRITKAFLSDRAPPVLNDAVNQLIKQIHHANIN